MSRLLRLAPICLLFITPFILYFHTLSYPMVIDDHATIETNRFMETLQPIGKFFTNRNAVANAISGMGETIYRPLATLSLAINYFVSDLSPLGYRLTNVFFHALNGCFLFLLFRRCASVQASFIGSFFFLIHPVQIESVIWITQRSNLLCGLGVLCALTCWHRSKENLALIWLVPFAYILAIFSKEAALALPLYFLVDSAIDFQQRPSLNLMPRFLIVLGCLISAGLFFMLRHHVIGAWGQGLDDALPLSSSLLRSINALGLYGRNLIWPFHLNINYQPPFKLGITAWTFWLGSITLLLMGGLFIIFRRRELVWSGAFLFLIFWAPHSGFVSMLTYAADRFMYLMMIGISFLLAGLCDQNLIGKKWLGVLGIILLTGVLVTESRMVDWQSEQSLWESALVENPQNPVNWAAYASLFQAQGKTELAEKYFIQALSLQPFSALKKDITKCLALAFEKKGEKKKANYWWAQTEGNLTQIRK